MIGQHAPRKQFDDHLFLNGFENSMKWLIQINYRYDLHFDLTEGILGYMRRQTEIETRKGNFWICFDENYSSLIDKQKTDYVFEYIVALDST